jgi:hypothetical protein
MKSIAKKIITCSAVLFLLFSIDGCRKEGTGGKSSVNGSVKHHSKLIPYATVYIKYGVKNFPGTDPSVYSSSVTADANGYYEFKDLRKGDYYLYGVGLDSAGPYPVSGGIGVELKYNKETKADIPVTE